MLCFAVSVRGKDIWWGRGEGSKELLIQRDFLESKKSLKEILFKKKKDSEKEHKRFSETHMQILCVHNTTSNINTFLHISLRNLFLCLSVNEERYREKLMASERRLLQ